MPITEWSVLHDLAYIYLVLAHGTDEDLSEAEMQVMVKKLSEWQPNVSDEIIGGVLAEAIQTYAAGFDDLQLHQSIASVRDALPESHRMAALNDLVKIANADGLFLDTEEDLINDLVTAWDVDPSANYERRGSKE